MTETLILFIAIIFSAGIGAFLGLKFAQLKSKGNTSNLGPSTARATFALESIKPF